MQELVRLLERWSHWAVINWPVPVLVVTLLGFNLRSWFRSRMGVVAKLKIAMEMAEKFDNVRAYAFFHALHRKLSEEEKKSFLARLTDAEDRNR